LRHFINLPSVVSAPEGNTVRVWAVEVSGSGARLAFEERMDHAFDGSGWSVEIPRIGTFEAVKKWRRGTTVGVNFTLPLDEQDHLAARLATIVPRLG
jgi:hypothetical protein